MDEKAQGSLEYLLLIAGAILVAVIVVWLLTQTATPAKNQVTEATHELFNVLNV